MNVIKLKAVVKIVLRITHIFAISQCFVNKQQLLSQLSNFASNSLINILLGIYLLEQ